jgi:hypothetical protein
MGSFGRGKSAFEFIGPPGFEPGTPINPLFQRIDVCSVRTSYLHCAPTSVRYGNRGLWVLLGIGGGLRIILLFT